MPPPDVLEHPQVEEDTSIFTELVEGYDDEATCQINHASPLVPVPCTVVVVANGFSSCGHQKRMCQNGLALVLWVMQNGRVCVWCDLKAADCWTVVPA